MTESVQPKRHSAQRDWQSPQAAADYRRKRDPSRFHRYHQEEAVLTAWLKDLPARALVLDVPCGTGRWIRTLTDRGLRYIGGDVSLAMIGEARTTAGTVPTVGFVNADVGRLPFADQSVDCVIIWRLLHHVGQAEYRQAMLREAARISRGQVLLSFHHPLSFTHLRKEVQRKLSGRAARGSAITHWRLKREAEDCGLRLLETKGFQKFVSINWFACLVKARGWPGG
jgi:ubiquinone/menaquinone biosynthesis C-methylase UbiE